MEEENDEGRKAGGKRRGGIKGRQGKGDRGGERIKSRRKRKRRSRSINKTRKRIIRKNTNQKKQKKKTNTKQKKKKKQPRKRECGSITAPVPVQTKRHLKEWSETSWRRCACGAVDPD